MSTWPREEILMGWRHVPVLSAAFFEGFIIQDAFQSHDGKRLMTSSEAIPGPVPVTDRT